MLESRDTSVRRVPKSPCSASARWCTGNRRLPHAIMTISLLAGAAPITAHSQIPQPAGIRNSRASSEVGHLAAASHTVTVHDLTPTRTDVVLLTVALSSASALLGGGMGVVVDGTICSKRHHEKREPGLFGVFSDPCLFYTADYTRVGYFGGALLGATIPAANAAIARGCPPRKAWWRAVAGGTAGVLPGLLVALHHSEKTPPRRSAMFVTAPLFAAAGASISVVTCDR